MANFWENDPIVAPGSAPNSKPSPGAMPIAAAGAPAAGGEFWASDPIVQDEAAEPTAQERYDAALEKVRQLQFPEVDPEKFRTAMTERQATLIPGVTNSGPMAPYDATQLSQHGMFFGLTDEATAGIDALGAGIGQLFNGGKGPGMGDVYATRQELEAARRDLGREQSGIWGQVAELAGGLGAGGMAAKGAMSLGAKAPGMFQQAKGLLGASGSGAAYGFGSTDGGMEERGTGAAAGGLTGLAAGAFAPLVVRGAQKLLSVPAGMAAKSTAKSAIAAAPTGQQIRAASKASYRAAENTGAVVDGDALNLLSHDIHQFLGDAGMLLPKSGKLIGAGAKVEGALKALRQYTEHGSLTVKQAMTLNKTFRRAANSADPDEARIGAALVKHLDDFMENLPVSAFSTNGKAGMDAVKHWSEARKTYARFKRTDVIEKAIRNAGYAKDGFAEGLRSQFATILKSERKSRGFSPAELAAMDRYAKGGSIQDFLKNVGNGGSIPATVMGLATGGPLGAAVAGFGRAGAGKAARGAINAQAHNAANAVRAQVALPNGLPQIPKRSPPVIDGVARRLGVSAANPGLEDQRGGLVELLQGNRAIGGVR